MDRVDINKDKVELRRTRTLRNKDVDVKPREALKRKRTSTAPTNQHSTKEDTNKYTDEGGPEKISKLQLDKASGDGPENGDQNNVVEMDVEDHEDQDQDMSSEDERQNYDDDIKTKPIILEEKITRTLLVGNLETEEIKEFLRQQREKQEKSQEPELPKLKGGGDVHYQILSREPSRTGSASVTHKPLENRTDMLTARSGIRAYRNKMEEKARDYYGGDLQRDKYPHARGHTAHIHRTNNLPMENRSTHSREMRGKVVTRAGSSSPSRADAWGVCRWLRLAVLLLVPLALGLMGYQHFPALSITTGHQNRTLYSAAFDTNFAKLKSLFPSQRSDLWHRAKIHLKRHLGLINPTEPVSLILTSARGAEKTLACLAEHIAVSFSRTLKSSILTIDGTSKSDQDSDQVKLDIDNALTDAFEGGIQAAVIHRFEEIPPGSSLIFYRYCDHENAAFKNVFLVFTVLLPVDELDSKLRLNAVEEKVQEYIKERFIITDRTVTFNQMDVDKLSGLWSRISHVILPVATEQNIEQQGCTAF